MPISRTDRKEGRRENISRTAIRGEPDPATATLEDRRSWRHDLAALPQDDEGVRIAIAVAEAQIAKLRRRIKRG
jgi:hypothetical protein